MDHAPPGLRERHADLTRETILQALVEILAEGDLPEFSVQQVANRAGVSHRTVYRHYPSRDQLLVGLMGWIEERMVEVGAHFGAADTGELKKAVRTNVAVFDELAAGVEALTRFSLATGHEPPQRRQRNTQFTDIVMRELADRDADQAKAVAALVRMLASTRAWLVLRQDGITPPEDVASALAWAVEVLLDAAQEGNLPDLQRDTGGSRT